ncbi:hypothetical protein BO221_10170 [Archangium sp. Cb G35]|uniref:hypothetical protein n=1 Tax=Archangium sp. Cb G35 TaxID=1920190 RepID=UPI0009369F86|nr:hypothetical protein [Archangium sp. Cb G35]OJT26174.1 hypothetical protein BO221_10170 [Archangium sp. Cb G35]
MHALLTTLLVVVSSQAPVTTVPGEASVPRRSVWIQPIGTAFVGLAMGENSAFYLPLGANLPLGEDSNTSLGVELTVTTGSMRATSEYGGGGSRAVPNYWRVLAAAGPVLPLARSSRPLSGPFLQPKLITNVSYEPAYGYDDDDHAGGASLELQLGLDVGWQFTVGNVYLAPVLGVSMGYGFNMPGGGRSTLSGGPAFAPSRVFHPEFVGYEPRRGPAPVLGINLNLLRLGSAF